MVEVVCGSSPGIGPGVLEPSPQGPQGPQPGFLPFPTFPAFSRVNWNLLFPPGRSENLVGLFTLRKGFQGNTSTEPGRRHAQPGQSHVKRLKKAETP